MLLDSVQCSSRTSGRRDSHVGPAEHVIYMQFNLKGSQISATKKSFILLKNI